MYNINIYVNCLYEFKDPTEPIDLYIELMKTTCTNSRVLPNR